jgi:hypothetical protein
MANGAPSGCAVLLHKVPCGHPNPARPADDSFGATAFRFARTHAQLITRIGGALLIAVGVLEVTEAWTTMITWLKLHAISNHTSLL